VVGGRAADRRRVRTFLRLRPAACATFVLLIAPVAAPGPATAALPVLAPQPAAPAAALRDSVGVNIHLSHVSTPYNDFAAVKSALLDLGVRHVRDGACAGCTWLFPRIRELGAAGIRFTMIAGSPRNTTGTLADNLMSIKSSLLPAVEAVEGPNEWDISGDPAWAANLRAYQADLYARVQADALLRPLTVVGPSLVHPSSRATLGNLSSSLTVGNMHSYPGGQAPAKNLDSELALASTVSAAKPVMATETGYHNALATTGTHPPIDEANAGVYTERLPLDYYARGIRRAFLYQLLDERPDPGNADMQQHFGLLRNDLTHKPAFDALKALLANIGDGTPSTPRSLRYDLVGGDTSLRRLLFARADGSFSLVLWRDVKIWDTATRTPIAVGPTKVTVRFGDVVGAVTARRRTSTIYSGTAPATVPINLGVSPVVLRIVPKS
jgi:hypothetical protein